MKREDLKSLGLPDEQIEAVMSAHGQDVEEKKQKIEELQSNLEIAVDDKETLAEQLNEVNSKLQTLNEQLSGQENLQNQVSALQQTILEKESAIQQKEQEITRIAFSGRIKDSLGQYKPHNADRLMKLLNIEEIKEENGQIVGLEDQIKALQESDAYLFADSPPDKAGTHVEPTANTTIDMNALIRGAR